MVSAAAAPGSLVFLACPAEMQVVCSADLCPGNSLVVHLPETSPPKVVLTGTPLLPSSPEFSSRIPIRGGPCARRREVFPFFLTLRSVGL